MGIQGMKFTRAFLATGLFLVVLLVVYVVHARWFRVDVVLYSSVLDAVIAALLGSIVLWAVRWFAVLSTLEKVQLTAIWMLTGYALAITGPTVVDRSFSMYLLEKLAQRGGGIQIDAFHEEVMAEFMREHRLIDVRLTEQLESGTIRIEGDCVLLTRKGHRIAAASSAFRRYLLPRNRLLMGEYTDVLTHPLERDGTAAQPGYACGPGAPREGA